MRAEGAYITQNEKVSNEKLGGFATYLCSIPVHVWEVSGTVYVVCKGRLNFYFLWQVVCLLFIKAIQRVFVIRAEEVHTCLVSRLETRGGDTGYNICISPRSHSMLSSILQTRLRAPRALTRDRRTA